MVEDVLGALRFLIANPAIAMGVIAFAIGMSWVQIRILRRSLKAQVEENRSGWVAPAGRASRQHETGVGKEAILVMRLPRRQVKIAFWIVLFFGGGAVVTWLGKPWEPGAMPAKTLFSFVGAGVFVLLSVVPLVASRTRIEVSATDIVQRRFLRRPRRFVLGEIAEVSLARKNPAAGVTLRFADGRRLDLLAHFEGYAQVLQSIQKAHPDLPKLLLMGRMVDASLARGAAGRQAG